MTLEALNNIGLEIFPTHKWQKLEAMVSFNKLDGMFAGGLIRGDRIQLSDGKLVFTGECAKAEMGNPEADIYIFWPVREMKKPEEKRETVRLSGGEAVISAYRLIPKKNSSNHTMWGHPEEWGGKIPKRNGVKVTYRRGQGARRKKIW